MTFDTKNILGAVTTPCDGVTLVVSNKNRVFDYTSMVAAQLSALTVVMAESDGFSQFNNEIQSNILWLVETMAREVCQLIPLVAQDAENQAKAAMLRAKTE